MLLRVTELPWQKYDNVTVDESYETESYTEKLSQLLRVRELSWQSYDSETVQESYESP